MARGTIVSRQLENGTKRYDTVIRVNGKQRWKTFTRKREAEDYLDRHSTDVRDGTYREIRKATFGEYVAQWRSTHLIPEKYKPSTYNGWQSILEHHLLPEFKQYPLQAISPAEINAFTAKLIKGDLGQERRPVTLNTVRNVLNLLNKIFKKAVSESYLRISPMMGVDRPQVSKEQKGRALKPDEIQSILNVSTGRFRAAFVTAVATGMRRAEELALDWENVDFGNNVIRVRRSLYWKFGKYHDRSEDEPRFTFVTPKSKKSMRDIDMSPGLRKELLALCLKSGRQGLVFCTAKGTPINPDNLKRDFQKVLAEAEAERAKLGLPAIGKVRWHDLRHTFGSLKLDQGEDPLYVSRQMGHGSLQVTAEIYAHLIRERRPEAAAKTDAAIFGK